MKVNAISNQTPTNRANKNIKIITKMDDAFILNNPSQISFVGKLKTIQHSINKLTNKFDYNFLPSSETEASLYVKKFKNLILRESAESREPQTKMNIFRVNPKNKEEKQIHSYYFVFGELQMSESYYPNGKIHVTLHLKNGKLKSKIFRRKNYSKIPMSTLILTHQAPHINRIEKYRADGSLALVQYYNKDGYISKSVKHHRKNSTKN